MTPSLPSVIVNAYLPPLTLSLGYVHVAGLWNESGAGPLKAWRGKGARPPEANWKKVQAPPGLAWRTERP